MERRGRRKVRISRMAKDYRRKEERKEMQIQKARKNVDAC
jgi:hypothetical protein